ncbi:hypothetical protein HDV00_006316 [Rhizophlyctis rosea]|nr:hypothetical protein HDV00_006316 [Rhizophlyctis rosea]
MGIKHGVMKVVMSNRESGDFSQLQQQQQSAEEVARKPPMVVVDTHSRNPPSSSSDSDPYRDPSGSGSATGLIPQGGGGEPSPASVSSPLLVVGDEGTPAGSEESVEWRGSVVSGGGGGGWKVGRGSEVGKREGEAVFVDIARIEQLVLPGGTSEMVVVPRSLRVPGLRRVVVGDL